VQVTDNRTDGGRKARRRGYTAMPRGWREAVIAFRGPATVSEIGRSTHHRWTCTPAGWPRRMPSRKSRL
jgi:hypothetical protein